ncbi:MAG: leucine-rich repeat domain-containing protein, partial [Erysipelotrichaceae bacterium]|nr:leucine-rich repeat domain-containing protein [Erysipelotrichaceae bacterium]
TGFNYQAGLSPEEITIPAKHTDGTVITAIGNNAFSGAGLTKVEFEEDSAITTIGINAFKGNFFEAIDLPKTVTTLQDGCFSSCSKLTSIDLYDYNIDAIPDKAFASCGSLTTVVLPQNLKTIGSSAFSAQDNKLSGRIKIPASVTSIGSAAFYYANCTLDLTDHAPGSIPGQPWNAYYSYVKWAPNGDSSCFVFNSETGLLCGLKAFNKDTGLHEDDSVCSNTDTHTKGTVVIPKEITNNKGVTKEVVAINSGAFTENTGKAVITSLDFEEGSVVKSIGDFGFFSCSKLKEIRLPDSMESIAYHAFSYTSISSLTIPSSVKNVGESAFTNCSKLTTVTIGDEENGSALADKSSIPTLFNATKTLQTINVPGNTEGTVPGAPWGGIYAKVVWKDVTTPPQVVETDDKLWEYNTVTKRLVNYIGPTGDNVDLVVPQQISYTLSEGDTPIVENITTIGDNAVKGKKSFASVTIPDCIVSIGYAAFQNTKIGKLDLGKGLTGIGGATFRNCGLKEVVFPESLKTIQNNAFQNNELTTVTLPEGVTTIGNSAFAGNRIAGDVVLPSTLITVYGGTTGSFAGNDGIVSFHILQGRNGVVPATDDRPALPKANATVQGAAPFGAEQCANQVYYADDPQPVPSHTVMADTENNKAVIKLSI